MNPAPFCAEVLEVCSERRADPVQLRDRKPVILSQLGRSIRAVEIENRLLADAYHMDMRGTMVVWVDDHSQCTDSRYGRHSTINLSGLGLAHVVADGGDLGNLGIVSPFLRGEKSAIGLKYYRRLALSVRSNLGSHT